MAHLHTELLKLAKRIGYAKETSEGLCHGLTMRWIEACLLGDEEVNRLIDRMNDLLDPSKTIDKHDLHAFLDSLILYHHPEKYPDIHGGYYSQHNIKAVSRMAASDLMKAQGGLVSIDMQSWMYTQDDIGKYLQLVANQLESLGSPEPSTIALTLDGTNHSIGLTYQVGTGLWTVMDINQWPARSSTNLDDITPIIYQGFMRANNTDSPFVGFNTSIVMTGNQAAQYHDTDIMALTATNYPLSDEVLSRHSGGTLAYIAAKKGHADVIKALANAGANLNIALDDGMTPAFIAAQEGHAEVIKALAKAQADLSDDTTLAFMAAQYGHAAVIKVLAEAQADLNTPFGNGVTPAIVAAQNGHTDVIKALAEVNPSLLDVPNNDGVTPASIAAQLGHADVIKALAEAEADLSSPNKIGITPAYVAAQNGHAKVIKALTEAHADLSSPNEIGITPAAVAALNGHAAVIRALAGAGVSIDTPHLNGTPAFIAAQFGHADVIRALAEICPNILDIPNNDGITPAFIAAQLGYTDVIRELAKGKADLSSPENRGMTPAYIAAQRGHAAIIRELAQGQADLSTPHKYGSTPAYIAATLGYAHVIQALADAHADLSLPVSSNGKTPAYIGAEKGYLDVIRALLETNADVTTPNVDGITPEQIASMKGHDDIVSLLQEKRSEQTSSDKPRHGSATGNPNLFQKPVSNAQIADDEEEAKQPGRKSAPPS